MSAIRSLIDANRAAYRAYKFAVNEADLARLAGNEAASLNALIAEPARTIDQAMAKARYLADEHPEAVSYMCGNPDILTQFLRSFVHADPAVYAIDNHRAACQRLEKIQPHERGYDDAKQSERTAWHMLAMTAPTTLDGTVRLLDYATGKIEAMEKSSAAVQMLETARMALARLTTGGRA